MPEAERKTTAAAKRRKANGLAARIAAYFEHCDEQKRKPTWPGLAGWLDTTAATLTAWRNGTGVEQEITEVIQKAGDALSDRLQQRTDSMAVFSLKQPIYGGYGEKQESGDGTVSIKVNFGGSGQDAGAEYGK